MEVFLDKRVRETRQTPGANSRRGTTKKREISRTLLSINLHFSVDDVLQRARRLAVRRPSLLARFSIVGAKLPRGKLYPYSRTEGERGSEIQGKQRRLFHSPLRQVPSAKVCRSLRLSPPRTQRFLGIRDGSNFFSFCPAESEMSHS